MRYIKSISCDEKDDFYMPLNHLQSNNNMAPIEEVIDLTQKIIIKEQEELITLKERFKEIENKLGEVNKLLGKAEAISKAKSDMEKAKSILEQKQPLLYQLKQNADAAQMKSVKRDELAVAIETANNKLAEYDELEKQSNKINQYTQNVEMLKQQLEKDTLLLKQIKQMILNEKDTITTLKDVETIQSKLEIEKKELENKRERKIL